MQNQGIRDARSLGAPEVARSGPPAHVRHVRRDGARARCLTRPFRYPRRCCSPVSARCSSTSCTKGKVPAFLGSSFAYLGRLMPSRRCAPERSERRRTAPLRARAGVVARRPALPDARSCWFKRASARTSVMRFFPPVVTGPIIICIGLTLAGSAINNCHRQLVASPLVAMAIIVVIFNIWGKGMVKIIPILLGVRRAPTSYAAIAGRVDFSGVSAAPRGSACRSRWQTPSSALIGNCRREPARHRHHRHHAHRVCHHDRAHRRYLRHLLHRRRELHRRSRSAPHPAGRRSRHRASPALFGAPCQHHLRREHRRSGADPRSTIPLVIRLAAVYAIIAVLLPQVRRRSSPPCPPAIIGGVSLILYGMISAVGVRNLVENQRRPRPRAATSSSFR